MKNGDNVNLRVTKIEGGSAICEVWNGRDSGREVKVNFQNIPFEVQIGDNVEATIYYTKDKEIESVIVTQRSRF